MRILHVFLLSAFICLTLAQEKTFAAPCPCDIFADGGTPCVAAHSTVRALYSSYNGPLYQVRRLPDTANKIDIYPLTPGGVANSAVQDSFLGTKAGTISKIYDQSGKQNHLTRSLGGGQVCMHVDQEAVANALPFMLGGHKVYGIKVISDDNGGCTPPAGSEGTGYRLDKTTGIATGDQAETEYMVTSGNYDSYQNSGCCYDYGNVETNDEDDGAATMEALYFGGGAGWGHGGGNGPWVLADMENGVFSGSTNAYTGNTSVPYPYVTAALIGRTGGTYALLAGNAQSGALTTMYDGARPNGYTVMKKQGAIVLGTGGDNSDHGKGYFYEGVMTSGAASIATMNQVQANIVAVGYGSSNTSGIKCPCDIFNDGGTPCVAAHSTTRALYGSYNGPLYQVRRLPDTANKIDIYPLTPGGVANSAVQDSFLGTKAGTISKIYDQSGKQNHLTRSLGGGQVCMHVDQEAVANALPFMLGGHKVYGIKVISDDNGGCTPPAGSEGTGYRLDKTTGIATGDQAETEYMVTSGDYASYQNSGCCYDYGNVETNDEDDGAATMEAVYFGGGAGWGHGGGNGPWVLADMENGVFSGSTNAYTGNTSVAYSYVTAALIGRTGGTYALLAGNAQSGALTTMYDGARPNGYTVMKKQGAIVLGTGGDNSDHGKGYFYEGVMTSGAASVTVMNLVHANIVGAGYGSSVVATRHSANNAPKTASPCNVYYSPSTGSAVISYNLQDARRVSMDIVDQQGRRIATIINSSLPAGRHETVWNAKSIPAGVYLWKIAIDDNEKWSGKIIIGK